MTASAAGVVGWTGADQAELDVLVWELVTRVPEHRRDCDLCAASEPRAGPARALRRQSRPSSPGASAARSSRGPSGSARSRPTTRPLRAYPAFLAGQ